MAKDGRTRAIAFVYTYLHSIPLTVAVLFSVWILSSRPFDMRSVWLIPAVFLFSAVGVGLGYLLQDMAIALRKRFRVATEPGKIRQLFIAFLLPLIVTAAVHIIDGMRDGAGHIGSPSTEQRQTDTRLVVIGLDGATFDVMDRLLEKGKLPNIQFLMENGSYGNLPSNVSKLKAFTNSASMGMRSPALWESMATGMDERKHGIFDFAVMRVPLLTADIPFRLPLVENVLQTIPTTSTVGKARRVWDILSGGGVDVGVIGWWNLWPVSPVENGYIVSSRAQWGSDGSFYPPDLLSDVPDDLAFTDEKPFDLFLNRWEGLEKKEAVSIAKSSNVMQNFDSFRRHFNRDNYIAGLSLHLMQKHRMPFFTTYFWGPDFVCHLFWKYMEASAFEDVREEDARLFGEIIDRYYMYLDGIIGELMEADSLDATYMILSDHGLGAWEEEGTSSLEYASGSLRPTYSGKHRENGIIIMSGKHIKKGQDMSDATLFDITPTILALFGFPVALDMDGRVLVEVLDDEFLQQNPVRYVSTYQSGETIVPVGVSSEADDEIKERLRALGYIN
jgi:predicted AlkP superfamily phosphohydrolase/phosphomutase